MDEKNINDVWLLLGQMDSKLDRVVEDTSDHETRINSLEKEKWLQRGGVAVIGAIISALGVMFYGK